MGSFAGEKVGRTLVTARTIFARGVVPELISRGLGEEVSLGGKDLSIEQLGFDGVMDTFDIGIGVGTGGRVEAVLGAEALLDAEMKALGPVMDGIAIELDAQIGGEDDWVGIQAVLLQVSQKAPDGEGGVGFGQFVAVGQELGAAGQFANGVLEVGQTVALHLGPVEGDVGEVFDIHLEASKRHVSGFDGAQVVLAAVAALGGPGQLVGVNDPLSGIVAQRQIELCNEPASAKAGGFLA